MRLERLHGSGPPILITGLRRRHRFLEDHRDAPPAQCPPLCCRQVFSKSRPSKRMAPATGRMSVGQQCPITQRRRRPSCRRPDSPTTTKDSAAGAAPARPASTAKASIGVGGPAPSVQLPRSTESRPAARLAHGGLTRHHYLSPSWSRRQARCRPCDDSDAAIHDAAVGIDLQPPGKPPSGSFRPTSHDGPRAIRSFGKPSRDTVGFERQACPSKAKLRRGVPRIAGCSEGPRVEHSAQDLHVSRGP